jgi:hypothetical protein
VKDFVELEKGTILRKDGDTIVTTYKKGAIVDLIDAKEIDRIYTTMAQGQDVFSLVDLRAAGSDLTNEAQTYFSRKALIVPNIKGAAIVIEGVRSRIVARFYIQYFKPLYPTKIFGNIDEAVKWFETLRKEELVG